MPITGDFAALADFAAKTGKLATFVRDVALGSVKGIEAATVAEFSASADPYGNPWAPMKRGGGAPLESLSGEVEVTAFGEGKIRASAEYPLNFHNVGTRQLSAKAALKQVRLKAGVGNGRDKSGRFTTGPRGADAAARAARAKIAATKAELKEAAKAASQAGGQHDPKRQVVPGAGKMPESWDAVIIETAQEMFAKAVG